MTEYDRITQNVTEYDRIGQNTTEYDKTRQNTTECVRIAVCNVISKICVKF